MTTDANIETVIAEMRKYAERCGELPHGDPCQRPDSRDLSDWADRLEAERARARPEPVAWMHQDGRVVPAATMANAVRNGGASLSSLRDYSIPLVPPIAAAVPTMQQISDYLASLDAISREVVERDSRALAAQLVTHTAMPEIECHGLDTPERVCFYEQDFYVLSNFSAFSLQWRGMRFDTSEAAYHYEKFLGDDAPHSVRYSIRTAPSAHEAFKLAERYKAHRRDDWEAVKVDIMRDILRAKANQHEYVRRKLLATGERELVENSWRDDYWGWGPRRDGRNMLGKLWMEVRAELRAALAKGGQA